MRRLSYPQRSLDHLGFPAVSWYGNRVRSTAPNNLIGYWPLIDPSGAVARNYGLGGTSRDGAITGGLLNQQPGIGDGHGCYSLDGSGDFVNVYSASLAADFNGSEGTLIAWSKVADAAVWTDATVRRVFTLTPDSANSIVLQRTATNNQFQWYYEAGDVVETVSSAALGGRLTWMPLAITWSKSAELVTAYADGAVVSTSATLGVWSGALAATRTVIGASDTVPANVWNGSLAHVALWNVALTPTQIFYLSRV